MSLPYESATSGERALGEIQKLLRGFGCSKFGSMIDDADGTVLVQFEYKGRPVEEDGPRAVPPRLALRVALAGAGSAAAKEHKRQRRRTDGSVERLTSKLRRRRRAKPGGGRLERPVREHNVGRVLIACEYSGRVRDAFADAGHDAWSCDLLPSERPGQHYQGDVRDLLAQEWDLMIAHPPCTHLAVSGARHFAAKQASGVQEEALAFVRLLLDADVPRIALENPVSIISTRIRKPDQIIQPWMFGHGETKATCLWLKGLPKLMPTQMVDGRKPRVHYMPPSPNRWKERSRTYEGIAAAMAQQWGPLLPNV